MTNDNDKNAEELAKLLEKLSPEDLEKTLDKVIKDTDVLKSRAKKILKEELQNETRKLERELELVKIEALEVKMKLSNLYYPATEFMKIEPNNHEGKYLIHRYGSMKNQTDYTGEGMPTEQMRDNGYIHGGMSFHSSFQVLQVMDQFAEYLSGGEQPVFSQFNTFLFIMGYAGDLNLPVDIFGMPEVLGYQQATLSRILSALSEPTQQDLINKADLDNRVNVLEDRSVNYKNPAIINAVNSTPTQNVKKDWERAVASGDMDDIEETRFKIATHLKITGKRSLGVKHGLIKLTNPLETKNVKITLEGLKNTPSYPLSAEGFIQTQMAKSTVDYGGRSFEMHKDFRQEIPLKDGRKKYVNLTEKGMEVAHKIKEVLLYEHPKQED